MRENKLKKSEINFNRAFKIFNALSFCSQCSQSGIIDITQTQDEQIKSCVFALGVKYRTIQNWRSGGKVHPSATRLLFNMSKGIIQNSVWCGWRVNGKSLISPTHETINPDIIGRLWLWRSERDLKERRIMSLESKLAALLASGQYADLDIEAIKQAARHLSALFNDKPTQKTGT
jgi:hypothetical protein